jgi:hypothetical protein
MPPCTADASHRKRLSERGRGNMVPGIVGMIKPKGKTLPKPIDR